MDLQPIETFPKDGHSYRVPQMFNYTYVFYQDGYWWWHSLGEDNYAVGPQPDGWFKEQ